MLVWIPLLPIYLSAFEWRPETRLWRRATCWWWGGLVLTGWVSFLPGVLDRMKFTDGLVGHSFVAMGGFTSSLIIVVMIQLLGEDGWIFNRGRSFYTWHAAVLAYALIMTVAGWIEGADPRFTIVRGGLRDALYTLRLLTGIAMLLASVDWLRDATELVGGPARRLDAAAGTQEKDSRVIAA